VTLAWAGRRGYCGAVRWTVLILLAAGCGLEKFPDPDARTGDSGDTSPLAIDDTGKPIGADDTGKPPADDNTAPNADAGDDAVVAIGTVVQLDGTGSSDPDGDPLDFAWSILSQPGSDTLIDDDLPDAQIQVNAVGLYELELVVSDGALTDGDRVYVQAQSGNTPPVADAGTDRTVTVGGTVTLDGTGSYDADGDALNYAWTLTRPAGSSATLSSATASRPNFTADVTGTYTATLEVDDGDDADTDEVRVTAEESGSGGSGGSGGGGSSCISCSEADRAELRRRQGLISALGGPGLVLLPAMAFLVRRKKAKS